MKLEIVFENPQFVVLDKPAQVLTTPSREQATDDRACLGLVLQEHLGVQIFPIHRLDFEVSGLVMFAKDAKAHALANSWFERKSVFKTYQAFTTEQSFAHVPPQVVNKRQTLAPTDGEKFLWKSRLLRGKKRAYEHATGKPSETEVLYRGKDPVTGWLRWELHPLTGRPHQLRFELSHHGFSIVGDTLYGSPASYPQPGIALRAVKIDFTKAPGAPEAGLPAGLEIPGLW